MIAAIDRFDEAADRVVDRLRGVKNVDRLMYTASEAADFAVLWHLLGAMQGLVRRDGFSRAMRLSCALGAESALVNGAIKSLFKRSRPVLDIERPLHLRIPLTSSFPSGHASSAFLAASVLAKDSATPGLYYALAAVVAWSRMHVRIHHASDVVGGAALGLVLGAIANRVAAR